ncbi:MAG: patatin-like phospholipase family protein [Pseudobacteriovorax sp.]|nr:patatin-like phospholipase family protein [Pseudobacteriovorax sp.]
MYRLLNIPGGGVRGIISAVILDRLCREKVPHTQKPLLDLEWIYSFAGTSTGSIIAAALAAEILAPHEIVEKYKELCEEVFQVRGGLPSWSICKWGWRIIDGAPYDLKRLENVLESQFKGIRLKDVPNLLVLTTWNEGGNIDNPFKKRAPLIIHNHPTKQYAKHLLDCKLSALVAASCAAPHFFKPKVLEVNHHKYILADGGLVGNAAAFQNYLICRSPYYDHKVPRKDIVSFSIGNDDMDTFSDVARLNVGWAAPKHYREVLHSIVGANMAMDDLSMKTFLGERYFYQNVPGPSWDLDDTKSIDEMEKRARELDLSDAMKFLNDEFL